MYIYIGTYYHTRHKGTISVIDESGNYVTLEKKIGKTINLEDREYSLNRTKSQIGYTFLKAWKTDNQTDKVELAIHDILSNVRSEGEWFQDDDDTLVDRISGFMNRMGFPEVSLDNATEELATAISRYAIPPEKINAHRELYDRHPGVFTGLGKDYVANREGDLRVDLNIKARGFSIGIVSPDYLRYPCNKDQEFQNGLTTTLAAFNLVPSFNAKAGYVTQIEDENYAVQVFKAIVDAVKSKQIAIDRS